MRRAIALMLLLLASMAFAQEVQIRMMAGVGQGIPPKEDTNPRSLARRAVFEEFHRQNPDVRVVNAGGLEMTGERAESMFLMSMAGNTAPDVMYVNFRQYYNYIDQGFCRRLDDLIAKDPGVISRANPVALEVLKSYNGGIYAIPWFQVALGLYYRRDHFREAGLDPNRPPRTWDELYEYAQKLSMSAEGRLGYITSKPAGYHWSNFVYQAGGTVVKESEEPGVWKSNINSPEAAQALEFFRKMMVAKWKDDKGKMRGPAGAVSTNFNEDIRSSKASMWFTYVGDVMLNMQDLPPSVVGIAAMPKGPADRSNEINAGMWAINARVTDPKKLDACWRFIKFFAGDEAARINTESFVNLGLGSLVNPTWLKKYGYETELAQVDPEYVKANEELFAKGHPEPYGRNMSQVYVMLDQALDRAVLEPNTPAATILGKAQKDMDQVLLGYTPPEVLQTQRAWATGILIVILLGLSGFVGRLVWKAAKAPKQSYLTKRLNKPFVVLCLAPAALTLLVWAYYPLLRGLMMAFQDYRIVTGTKWVGLDNFISVFTQPMFYKALGNSFIYVGMSIVIGFLLPIFLALALNEIPRAKVFFRTIFYLPAMTSPIVIAFLWRQFYDKTEAGLLNSIIAPFIDVINNVFIRNPEAFWPKAYDWLGNPQLAMFAVVLPGIWAGAGPGSILYLAAMKNIPDERYEAADLDGANWRQKIRAITMPGLKPLILINLLGVFIGGFKAMENIFVLTMGGPLGATHTMGLEVWMNAFMYLKFGYATAAAWVMGSILIGFTLLQIRSLLRMRFTAAKL
ncbi:MAG: extracellular solute-binding protein [Fimbriimonadaceae bacterium]|nr:extracellular solute-binding protein [Fimbriimonadaceae bacterium]